jgi:hypothetical protein
MSTCGPVWLQLAEKRSGVPSLTDDEAVGLCYGWIPGQRKGYDVPVAVSSEPDAAQA